MTAPQSPSGVKALCRGERKRTALTRSAVSKSGVNAALAHGGGRFSPRPPPLVPQRPAIPTPAGGQFCTPHFLATHSPFLFQQIVSRRTILGADRSLPI